MLSCPPKSNLLWGWCKLLRLRRHLSLWWWFGKHCLKESCFLVQFHRWWSCAVQRWKSRYPHAIRMTSLYSTIEIEGSAHMPRSEIIKGISYGRRPQMQTAFGIGVIPRDNTVYMGTWRILHGKSLTCWTSRNTYKSTLKHVLSKWKVFRKNISNIPNI